MNDFHKPLPKDRANTIEVAIKKIRNSPIEHLYIFKNGKQIRRFKGDKNYVAVDNKYLFEIKDASVVHNHPQGASFSFEDIEGIIRYDAAECIVATEKFTYKVVRPKKGWNINVSSEEYEQQLLACKQIAEVEINKLISNNTINPHEKEVEIFHYIWVLF